MISNFQSGCPDGCPCPVYQCPVPIEEAVMVLNSAYSGHKQPISLDIDGNFYNVNLTFDQQSTTYASCSIMDQNQMYVYGGGDYDKKRQISLIDECQLKQVGTLPFDLDYGTCTRNDNFIVWCFDYDLTKSCWKSEQPTSNWSQVQNSNFDHRKIRISASKGNFTFSIVTKTNHIRFHFRRWQLKKGRYEHRTLGHYNLDVVCKTVLSVRVENLFRCDDLLSGSFLRFRWD